MLLLVFGLVFVSFGFVSGSNPAKNHDIGLSVMADYHYDCADVQSETKVTEAKAEVLVSNKVVSMEATEVSGMPHAGLVAHRTIDTRCRGSKEEPISKRTSNCIQYRMLC